MYADRVGMRFVAVVIVDQDGLGRERTQYKRREDSQRRRHANDSPNQTYAQALTPSAHQGIPSIRPGSAAPPATQYTRVYRSIEVTPVSLSRWVTSILFGTVVAVLTRTPWA
jgi:hypothetical protein